MSERGRALSSFDHARVLLEDGTRHDDPWWSWWIDDAELAWHKGIFHAELDDWKSASEAYRNAVESRAAIRAEAGIVGRSRVLYNDLAHYADALAAIGSWNDLELVLEDVAGYGDTIGSARTRLVLRRIIRRVHDAAPVQSTLTDLADLIGQMVEERLYGISPFKPQGSF